MERSETAGYAMQRATAINNWRFTNGVTKTLESLGVAKGIITLHRQDQIALARILIDIQTGCL